MSHEETAQKKATAAKKKAESKGKSKGSPAPVGKGQDEWSGERELPVELGEDELIRFKDSILALLNEIDILKGEAAEKASTYRARIKMKESELGLLRDSVENGTEKRVVATREVPDFKKGTVKVYRKDSNEFVEERMMLPQERQREIEATVDEKKSKAKKPASKPKVESKPKPKESTKPPPTLPDPKNAPKPEK